MSLTDENAFGMLVLLYGISDQEYGSEPEDFVEYFTRFRDSLLAAARSEPLGEGARALVLGHAVYFEVGDGDQRVDPITWVRSVCAPLLDDEFELAAIVTHGGRWVEADSPEPRAEELSDGYRVLHASRPSEPLQRALYASAFCHDADGPDGWGSALFVDTEVIEALGKQLKNTPTPLEAAGATFYRLRLARG